MLKHFAIILVSLVAYTSQASVTLSFSTNTAGFVATGNPGTFSWSPTNGGSMKLSAPGAVWQGDIAALSLETTTLWPELQKAATNGGTLSFDFIVVGTDQVYTTNPGWFQVSAVGNSPAGWLNNNLDTGLQWNNWPLNPNQQIFHFSLPIATNGVAGDGHFVVNPSQGWAKLDLGLNTDTAMSNAVAYINNITITANLTTSTTFPPPGYTLVWSDEFNGTALDTTKWIQEFPGVRRDAVNVTNAVSVTNGLLNITTYTQNGTNYTGMISTYGTYMPTYGYMVANIQFNEAPGMWSSFWMFNRNVTIVGNPHANGTEMDIIEHLAHNSADTDISSQGQSNIHWDGYGTNEQSVTSGLRGSGLVSGFHTYAVLWTLSTQNYYIDGAYVWSVTNSTAMDSVSPAVPVSQTNEYFILSSKVQNTNWAGTIPSGGYGSLATSTTRMIVDYMRCYQLSVLPAPRLNRVWINGTNFIIVGTNNNGTNPGTYQVITSSNLALPLTNWSVLATNPFNADGSFNYTNAITPAAPTKFFNIKAVQ